MTPARPGRAARLLPAPYRLALAQPGVRPLLAALAASSLGDGMSAVTVAWLALRLAAPGHAGVLIGIAVAASSLPGALGGPLLGRFLRRLDARDLLGLDCAAHALLLGAIPVAAACGVLDPAGYVALLAGSALVHAWGAAGQYTLLARLVPAEQRMATNSLVSTASSVATIVGPAIAGALVPLVGPAWLIGVDALSYAVLGVTARLGRTARASAGAPGERPAIRRRGGRARAGLRGLPAPLVGLLGLSWLFFFVYGPIEVALPLHVTADLHGSASLLGTYWAVYGVGAVLGGIVGGVLRRQRPAPTLLGIVAGWGIVLLPFAFPVPVWVTVGCLGLGGVIYGPYIAMSLTLFQARTPPERLPDVLAARSALNLTATPVGTALGGPLTSVFGPRAVIWGSGLVTIGIALCGALGWLALRRRDTEPSPAPARAEPAAEPVGRSGP